eukprot:3172600-Prymnesium_polylepis.1
MAAGRRGECAGSSRFSICRHRHSPFTQVEAVCSRADVVLRRALTARGQAATPRAPAINDCFTAKTCSCRI